MYLKHVIHEIAKKFMHILSVWAYAIVHKNCNVLLRYLPDKGSYFNYFMWYNVQVYYLNGPLLLIQALLGSVL